MYIFPVKEKVSFICEYYSSTIKKNVSVVAKFLFII